MQDCLLLVVLLGVPRLKSSWVGLSAASPRPDDRPAGFPLLSLTRSAQPVLGVGLSFMDSYLDGSDRVALYRGSALVELASRCYWYAQWYLGRRQPRWGRGI
jgi:hypothetical protein